MPDREKVINGLRSIKTYLASQAIETTDSFAREGFIESQKDIDDALAMLKEQEHKDRMYHALEDDWKRLKELLKEQEAIEPLKIPWLHSDGSVSEKYRCGSCDLSIFPSYKFCPFCGQAVKWE